MFFFWMYNLTLVTFTSPHSFIISGIKFYIPQYKTEVVIELYREKFLEYFAHRMHKNV